MSGRTGLSELLILLVVLGLPTLVIWAIVTVARSSRQPALPHPGPLSASDGLYHAQRGDARFGPYGYAELAQHVASGSVASTDMVWTEGMAAWAPAGVVVRPAGQ